MTNANFNLEEYCNGYKYFSIYLDLRFKLDRIKRRDILKGADVYQSAFSIAKRQEFVGHDEMIRKFEKYYNLQSIQKEEVQYLNENLTNLFLGIYYMDDDLSKVSYGYIYNQRIKFKNTYISIIIDLIELFYITSSQEYKVRTNDELYKNKIIEIHEYYELLLPELKVIYWLVCFLIHDYTIKKLNYIINEIEKSMGNSSFLKGYTYYRIAYAYHRFGYKEANIQYCKESMEYLISDINMKRVEVVQANLLVSYGSIGMTSKAYNHGKKLLLYLSSIKNNIKESDYLFYSVNYNMALICVELEKNEEALQYMRRAYEHDCYKIGQIALYMYICYSLKDYETVKKLYSENLELIETTNLGVYQKTIELIYHKVMQDVSKKQLRKDWKELSDFLVSTTNYNVARYIDKLK